MFWCCNVTPEDVRGATASTEVSFPNLDLGAAQRQRGNAQQLLSDEERAAQLSPIVEFKTEEAEEVESEEEDENGLFDVTLEMTPGERLGALLDVLDLKTLRIVMIREQGRLRNHNERAKDHKKVLPGYFIMSVNGKSGKAEKMVEEMRRTRTWRLKIARSFDFNYSFQKTRHLCLDLQFEKDSDCIVVRKIGDAGVVKAQNEKAADALQRVRVGDRIIDVNDTGGPAKRMLQRIKDNDDLTLKITRPLLKSQQSSSLRTAAMGGA